MSCRFLALSQKSWVKNRGRKEKHPNHTSHIIQERGLTAQTKFSAQTLICDQIKTYIIKKKHNSQSVQNQKQTKIVILWPVRKKALWKCLQNTHTTIKMAQIVLDVRTSGMFRCKLFFFPVVFGKSGIFLIRPWSKTNTNIKAPTWSLCEIFSDSILMDSTSHVKFNQNMLLQVRVTLIHTYFLLKCL